MRQLITLEPQRRYRLVAGDSTRGYYTCEIRTTSARRMIYVSHDGGSKIAWMAAVRTRNATTRTGLDHGDPSYLTSGGDSLAVSIEPISPWR